MTERTLPWLWNQVRPLSAPLQWHVLAKGGHAMLRWHVLAKGGHAMLRWHVLAKGGHAMPYFLGALRRMCAPVPHGGVRAARLARLQPRKRARLERAHGV